MAGDGARIGDSRASGIAGPRGAEIGGRIAERAPARADWLGTPLAGPRWLDALLPAPAGGAAPSPAGEPRPGTDLGALAGVAAYAELAREAAAAFPAGPSPADLGGAAYARLVDQASARTGEDPDFDLLAGRLATARTHAAVPADIAPGGAGRRCAEFEAWYAAEYLPWCAERGAVPLFHGADAEFGYFATRIFEQTYMLGAEGRARGTGERIQHVYLRTAWALAPSVSDAGDDWAERDADAEEAETAAGVGCAERAARRNARLTEFLEMDAVTEAGGDLRAADPRAPRDTAAVRAYYLLLAGGRVSHATPTLANAACVGTKTTLASCFLYTAADTAESWLDTFRAASLASKSGGGVGVSLSAVRAHGAPVRGTGGSAGGVRGLVGLFETGRRLFSQGGSAGGSARRPGATALYLEAWHPDVFTFLAAVRHRDSEGAGADSAVLLKVALWVPDLFMERLAAEVAALAAGDRAAAAAAVWTLVDPLECPGLPNLSGGAFRDAYAAAEAGVAAAAAAGDAAAAARRVSPSRLFREVVETISQSGCYVLFKDNAAACSALAPVSPICGSNLCAEVLIPSWGKDSLQAALPTNREPASRADAAAMELADGEEGVCVLGALPLASFTGGMCPPAPSRPAAAGSAGGLRPPAPSRPAAAGSAGGESGAEKYSPPGESSGASTPGGPGGSKGGGAPLDWEGLADAAGALAAALDRAIDRNYYPTAAARRSTMRHRPLGIGTMGLADVFARVAACAGDADAYAFGEPAALALDAALHAVVYYGAARESARRAAELGPFPSWPYSAPARRLAAGLDPLQLDQFCEPAAGFARAGRPAVADVEAAVEEATGGWLGPARWAELRAAVAAHGLRNAYLTASMPTATTSTALGQSPACEPPASHIVLRTNQAGEFVTFNREFVAAARRAGLWGPGLRRALIANGGAAPPEVLAAVGPAHRIGIEVPPAVLVRHAAARQPFVSQSQSLNWFVERVDAREAYETLAAAHHLGLVTGAYYVRARPASAPLATAAAAAAGSSAGSAVAVAAGANGDAAGKNSGAGAAAAEKFDGDAGDGEACPSGACSV